MAFLEKEWKDKNKLNCHKSESIGKNCNIENQGGIKSYLNKYKRNFLAHMGMENCITVCYSKDGTTYLRYKDEYKDAIKEFILNDFSF